MEIAYQVRVKSAAGVLQAIIGQENIADIAFARVVNGVGWHVLKVAIDMGDHFESDGQIEVWRNVDDYGWYLEYEGLHLEGTWAADAQMVETFTSRGAGYNDLLVRRCIAAHAGTPQTSKNGAAETIAKAFVDEQLVSPAEASRAMPEMSIEVNAGAGNVIRVDRAYRNVLEVLQEIARIGGGDFDIVGIGGGDYEFRWYNGQRGTDRRATIIFSTAFGNMLTPRLAVIPATASTVLVIGEGEGVARAWEWRPPLPGPVGMARREIVRDARDTDSADVMQRRGDAELERHRGRTELSFRAAQTMAYRYGVHYHFGDLVSAWYRGDSYDMQIVGVEISFGSMAERVEVVLEDV